MAEEFALRPMDTERWGGISGRRTISSSVRCRNRSSRPEQHLQLTRKIDKPPPRGKVDRQQSTYIELDAWIGQNCKVDLAGSLCSTFQYPKP